MKGYQTHIHTGILLNANEASQNVDDNIKQEIFDIQIQRVKNYIVCMQIE